MFKSRPNVCHSELCRSEARPEPGPGKSPREARETPRLARGDISGYIFVTYLALASFLAACAPGTDSLRVNQAWARPGLAGGTSAIYFVIENGMAGTDSLLSASSDVAGAVELHMTSMQDGNMQMLPQKEVPIQAGKTAFEPGGLHVMLIGLNQDLNPGDTFTLTLDFATAGEMPLEVTVREP